MFQHRQHHYAVKREKRKDGHSLEVSCGTDDKLLDYIIRLTAVMCQVTDLHTGRSSGSL